MSEYPEHDKLMALNGENQTLGLFLEWLQQRVVFADYHEHTDWCYDEWEDAPNCELSEGTPYPVHRSIQDWLAEYYGIDQNKLEDEKRQMLEVIRAQSAG